MDFVVSLIVELIGTVNALLCEANKCCPAALLIDDGTEELILFKLVCNTLLLLLLLNAFNCSATSLFGVANREECIITAPPLPIALVPVTVPLVSGDADDKETPETVGVIDPPLAAAFIIEAIARIGF